MGVNSCYLTMTIGMCEACRSYNPVPKGRTSVYILIGLMMMLPHLGLGMLRVQHWVFLKSKRCR